MSQFLKTTLDQFHPLSEDDFAVFLAIGQPISFEKKEFILRAEETCRGFYFIQSGSMRLYELHNGKEIHRDFFLEGDMATDLNSLRNKAPSLLNLVALEDTETLFFSGQEMFALYEQSPRFVELGRRILEVKLLGQMEFTAMLLSLTPQERYQHLQEHRPELIQRIPLQHLATYLGMTRETLSRVRGK